MRLYRMLTNSSRYWVALFMMLFVTQVTTADDLSGSTQGSTSENASTSSSEIEQAVSLVENKKYKEAFSIFKKLAEAGDPEAQHNLALLYRTGQGVEKDYTQSGHWFRMAADQGVSDAQYYLGYMYDTGEGVEQNRKYAYVWYRKAAEQGHGLAQINLGILYANGLGIPQDIEQAYLWFHVAAAQGYKAAFENKKIIEEAIGEDKLEALKVEGEKYFQKYVLPYQRHSRAYPQLRK